MGEQVAGSSVAIDNGRFVLPDRVVEDVVILVRAGKIEAILPRGSVEGAEVFDAGGRYVTPGLIDIHIHGAHGHTFNEPTELAFSTITTACAAAGVTSLLATTATAPVEELEASLAQVAQWTDSPRAGAQILGAHVEGPYFAAAQAGAQDPQNLRIPADGAYERLLAFAPVIRIFTYAPELPGAASLTQRLVELNIVPAAGHSAAREADLLPHLDLGLRHMIHLWSGQSTTVREGPWRRPGLLEVSLARDDISAEMIADGKHLPRTLMALALKCVGPGRLCLVSDATSGAGLAEGARFAMGHVEYEVRDGVGMLLDGTAFAGSTTLLNQMVRIVIEQVGAPIQDAVRMASLTPAAVIGWQDRKGSLTVGKDADIVVFDADWEPFRVMIGGQWQGAGRWRDNCDEQQ
jgi:N-acetylglucosamine-6-phosphate deacetylase